MDEGKAVTLGGARIALEDVKEKRTVERLRMVNEMLVARIKKLQGNE